MRFIIAVIVVVLFAGCTKKPGQLSHVGGWDQESLNYSRQVYLLGGASSEQDLKKTADSLADELLQQYAIVDVILVWDEERAKEAASARAKAALAMAGSWDPMVQIGNGGAFYHKARTGIDDPIAEHLGKRRLDPTKEPPVTWYFEPKH